MFEARTIAVCSGKGGVGKSSVVANIASWAAVQGRRVLVVDLDPDTNIGKDFGYSVWERPTVAHLALSLADRIVELRDDDGRALAAALMENDPSQLLLLSHVRENIDVLPGGAFLEDLVDLPDSFWVRRQVSRRSLLRDLLDDVAAPYDMVLIDTGPGHIALQEMAVVASQFVIVTTRSDEGSIGALAKIAKVFERVFDDAPDVELLGVVLFGVNPSATRVEAQTRAQIEMALGSAAPVFETTIRYLEAVAADCRRLGVLPSELARFVKLLPKHYEKGYAQQGRWSQAGPAQNLACDYQELGAEIASAYRSRILSMQQDGQSHEEQWSA